MNAFMHMKSKCLLLSSSGPAMQASVVSNVMFPGFASSSHSGHLVTKAGIMLIFHTCISPFAE